MMYKTKQLLIFLSIISILTGCSEKFKVTPVESLKIEYGDKLDNTLLFDKENSSEGTKVKLVEGFDSMQIGQQEITVTFTDNKQKKEMQAKTKVLVADTKKPIITLEKDHLEIIEGEKLDLYSMVKKVTDEIDGKLTYVKKKAKNGEWCIEDKGVNTNQTGEYTVEVIAVDNNGNETKKTINVMIKEKPVIKVETPETQESLEQEQNQEAVNTEVETKPQQNESNKLEKDENQNTTIVVLNNKSLQKQTEKILSSILAEDMDDTQRLYAIYKWVEGNINYDGNFTKSDWETMADTALKRRRGNCYAFYATSRALLSAAGYQNDMASFPEETHVWNRVNLGGTWYHFDTTTGWGGDRFLLTDDELRAYRYGDLYYVW